MPYDGLVLAAVTKELRDGFTGGRIERIYQPGKEEISMAVHRQGVRGKLLLSANPVQPRVHLTTAEFSNPITPPQFCMLLRKYLEGGRFSGFRQPELERVLVIEIDSRDELGHPAPKELIVEIMGKHSNIILVDPVSGLILDGIKRYSHAVSRHREVLPGRPYVAPPAQEKANPLGIGEEEFRNICLRSPLDTTLPQLLQNSFAGLSMTSSRELVYRAGLAFDTILDHCGEYELRALWQACHSFFDQAAAGCFHSCLLFDLRGTPVDFAALELSHTGLKQEKDSMNALLDKFYRHLANNNRIRQERNSILKIVNKELKKQQKKLAIFAGTLNDDASLAQYKLFGELLTANIYRLGRGMTQVALEDYQQDDEMITVPLDPRKSPVENAQWYFKQYNKGKNARVALGVQRQNTEEIVDYLESVKTNLEQCDDLPSLGEIKQELTEQGFLKPPPTGKAGKKKAKEKAKPNLIRVLSSDGLEILVGKNNRQNDYLTLKLAKDHDMWLHTKSIHGAHVIIRTEGGEIPPATLQEGALLAAYFSKGRASSNVPVDYTKRKHVNKPNAARPGMVIYTHQKTITCTPEEELVERILRSDM